MTDQLTDNQKSEQVRDAAARILRRLADAEQTTARASSSTRDSDAQARFAAILARLGGAELDLASALSGPGNYDMSALAGYEQLADNAVADAYEAEADGKATESRDQQDAAMEAVSRREIQSFMDDLFTRRPFDPYLHFDSEQEREEYERRRKEREQEINQHLAEGTPEGNLHALTTAQGQMLDDAAHGAADSPEFQQKWDELMDKIRRQKEAMQAAGMKKNDIDRMINTDLRHELERIGRPAAEIEQIMAHPEPMQAAKEQLSRHEGSVENLSKIITAPEPEIKVGVAFDTPVAVAGAVSDMPKAEAPAVIADASAYMEKIAMAQAPTSAALGAAASSQTLSAAAFLQAAGVTTDATPAAPGHGLNAQFAPDRAPGGRGQG